MKNELGSGSGKAPVKGKWKSFLKKWFPDPESYTEGRLFSLDLLRGCDMLFLVFLQPLLCVLDNLFKPLGHGLPKCVMDQLTHNWGGFTAYDIIMPMFIFMCGAAVPFALGRRLTPDGRPTAAFWKHVAWRVAVLWVFGMMAQGRLLTFDVMKISPYNNTLQTIAAGYLVAALVLLVRNRFVRWGIAAGLVTAYTAILVCCGDYSQTGNAAYRFDQWILTFIVPAGSKAFGEKYTWFLTSLMFGFMTLCGMFATEILTAKDRPMQAKARTLALFGAALLAVGWILVPCGIPMIKHIFTASFTLQAMGWCVLFLVLLYEFTDVLKWRKGMCVILLLGQFALLLYMANGVFGGCVRSLPKRLLADLPTIMGLPAKPETDAQRFGYALHSLLITFGYFATLIGILAIRYRLRQAAARDAREARSSGC